MFDRAIFELDGIKPIIATVVALTIARALAVVGQAVGLAQAIVGVWRGSTLEEQAVWIALFCFKPSSRPGLRLSANVDPPPW